MTDYTSEHDDHLNEKSSLQNEPIANMTVQQLLDILSHQGTFKLNVAELSTLKLNAPINTVTAVPTRVGLAGEVVLYKDTGNSDYRIYAYLDGAWKKVGDIDFQSDHGELDGLTDDDHTQYSKTDGSRAFTGTGAGFRDEDDMSSDDATAAASQQSIKKYVDDNAGINNVVEDTTPQLGGTLDYNGKAPYVSNLSNKVKKYTLVRAGRTDEETTGLFNIACSTTVSMFIKITYLIFATPNGDSFGVAEGGVMKCMMLFTGSSNQGNIADAYVATVNAGNGETMATTWSTSPTDGTNRTVSVQMDNESDDATNTIIAEIEIISSSASYTYSET